MVASIVKVMSQRVLSSTEEMVAISRRAALLPKHARVFFWLHGLETNVYFVKGSNTISRNGDGT